MHLGIRVFDSPTVECLTYRAEQSAGLIAAPRQHFDAALAML
jgi:hypothetical protein